MNNFELKREHESDIAEEIFSKVVRAGRRTYFFDVKATRNDDYYVTVTESRKKTEREGKFTFEKHKIHLYKEDFCKFKEGLDEVIGFIKHQKPECFNADGSTVYNTFVSLDEEFDKL